MQMIHCDIDDCKTAAGHEADQYGPSLFAPKGWAILQWNADGKGEKNRNSTLMAKYFKAISGSLPKRMRSEGGDDLKRVAEEMGAVPDALITFRAYVCPACLGKLALAQFAVVGRSPVTPPLFG